MRTATFCTACRQRSNNWSRPTFKSIVELIQRNLFRYSYDPGQSTSSSEQFDKDDKKDSCVYAWCFWHEQCNSDSYLAHHLHCYPWHMQIHNMCNIWSAAVISNTNLFLPVSWLHLRSLLYHMLTGLKLTWKVKFSWKATGTHPISYWYVKQPRTTALCRISAPEKAAAALNTRNEKFRTTDSDRKPRAQQEKAIQWPDPKPQLYSCLV